jgi:hypothetical protein
MSRLLRFLPWFTPALLALIAFIPALTQPGLPGGADVTIHYWRTFDLEHSWAQGDIIPRWSELFHYGYGSPGPAYTGGSAYLIAALAGLIPGIDDAARLKVVWGLGLLLISLGLYRFAARRWGAQVAMVVAASGLFAPATVFIEPIARGSFGVTLGIGCFCMALALLDEIAAGQKDRWRQILTVVLLVVMLQAHNLTSISALAVLIGWLGWTALFGRAARPCWRSAILLLILGAGLTAFFWLPVLTSGTDVSLERMAANENLDYRRHFESLGALLSPPVEYDPAMLNPLEKRSLGVASWMLGAFGGLILLVWTLRRKTASVSSSNIASPKAEPWFWFIVALTCIALTLPITRPLWERVGLLQTFRFPTRFLNFAAPALALVAGSGLAWGLTRASARIRPLLVAGLLIALVLQGVTVMSWDTINLPKNATVQGYFDYELSTGILGGTSANEFLPATVQSIPPPTGLLMDSLAAGEIALRVNPYTYPDGPDGTQFTPLESSATTYAVQVEAAQPLTVELFQLAFPGWTAELDGQPVDFRISEPFGFVLVEVPAGQHIIRLRYPMSGRQAIGWVVTALCSVALIGWLLRQKPVIDPLPLKPDSRALQALSLLLLVMFGLSLLVFRAGVLWQESLPGEARLAQTQTDHVFADGQIHLLGYTIELPQPDALWRISLFWQFDPDVPRDLNSFVHILNQDGDIVTQHDKFSSSAITVNPQWDVSHHVRDEYLPRLESSLPPGEYRIRIGWWRCPDSVAESCATPQDLGSLILPDTITRP